MDSAVDDVVIGFAVFVFCCTCVEGEVVVVEPSIVRFSCVSVVETFKYASSVVVSVEISQSGVGVGSTQIS